MVVKRELYVVSSRSSDVKVYDAVTFEFKSEFQVTGLSDPFSITSINQSLFISNNGYVYRIDIGDKKVSTKWKVGGSSNRLSVTKRENVLVTLFHSNQLHVYTPLGTLLISIQLSLEMHGPRHAIYLDGEDRFLFSQAIDGGSHRVCKIDQHGQLVNSYGGGAGSDTGQLYGPRQLAVDQNGFVFVACMDGKKVVLLDAELKFVKDINPLSVKFNEILTVCLDEHRGYLYVYDYGMSKLHVFEMN